MIARRLFDLLPEGIQQELALADFAQCDALTLWSLGRSSHEQGGGDWFGHELISLRIPVLYYWGRTNTPPETVAFIATHGVRNIEFDESGALADEGDPGATRGGCHGIRKCLLQVTTPAIRAISCITLQDVWPSRFVVSAPVARFTADALRRAQRCSSSLASPRFTASPPSAMPETLRM